ncbi:MAG: hydantoinase B/oxoprolinase family protein, partial [Chloroflexi bacterium]|nr:hydantoinase B/oxoprolinase family protein [Chloroflexota bacterium]
HGYTRPGKFRGGLGQVMELEIITGASATHSCMYDRTKRPALGLLGGQPGAPGRVSLSDGSQPHPKSHYRLQPGQRVILELPGGGGFGDPSQRDPQRVRDDVLAGYVSHEAAARDYGLVV